MTRFRQKVFGKIFFTRLVNKLGLVVLLFLGVGVAEIFGQTVTVTANQNNILIQSLTLTVEGTDIVQNSDDGNDNPLPLDVPVIVKSVGLADGRKIFATVRRPRVSNLNPLLGTAAIDESSVRIVRSDNEFVSHLSPDFITNLEEAVSTPDLRTYWDIGSQPSIPSGERFADLMYSDQVVTSGFLLYTERNGNSPTDFIALRKNGQPIPGANVIQVRGWQWNTGVNHVSNVPGQKQWMILFSPSIFESSEPIYGIRVISVEEPDGKIVFFVNSVSATPDLAERINGEAGQQAVLNVLDNDELNGMPVKPIDVSLSILEPFSTNSIIIDQDPLSDRFGTLDVLPNTLPGTYTALYEIRAGDGEVSSTTITIEVIAYQPEAFDDQITLLRSVSGQANVLNVLTNDLLNGLPADIADINLTTVENNTGGVLVLNQDGSLDLGADAPTGSYQLTYQICDKANPERCDQATVTVTLTDIIVTLDAVDDDFGRAQSATGGVVGNVLANDRYEGGAAQNSDVILSQVENNTNGVLTLNTNDGTVTLAPGTANGRYQLTYQICAAVTPSICDRAVAYVTVVGGAVTVRLVAVNDDFGTVDSATGGGVIGNVLTNDLYESGRVRPGDVQPVSEVVNNTGGVLTLNADGTVTLVNGAASGRYELTYRICASVNPAICSEATAIVVVTDQTIVSVKATDDIYGPVSSAVGGVIGNVLSNDLYESLPAQVSDVNISVIENNTGGVLTLNTADGTVSLARGAASGRYELTYSICASVNTAICSQAVVLVNVLGGAVVSITAVADNFGPVSSAVGGVVGNVLTNDLYESAPAQVSDVNISVVENTTGGVLTLNTGDGTVSLAGGAANGRYELTYRICASVNSAVCDQAVVSVTVVDGTVVILEAVDDNFGTVASAATVSVLGNVLANDLYESAPAQVSDVSISLVENTTGGVLSLNVSDGTVSLAGGAASGVYQLTYRICASVNSAICDQAVVSVTVTDGVIVTILAVDDTFGPFTDSGVGVVGNVLANDLYESAPARPEDVILTLGTNTSGGVITLNTSDGTVTLAQGAINGRYELTYQICAAANPLICSPATVTVVVAVPAEQIVLVAVDDDFGTVNHRQGGNVGNVLGNDLLNGQPVDRTRVGVVLSDGQTVEGLVLTDTGDLTVPAGLPLGEYRVEYELFMLNDPQNRDTGVITITVVGAILSVVDDQAVTNQNQSVVIRVLDNDAIDSGSLDAGTLSVTQAPENGTVAVNAGGTVTYTPNPNFSGQDQFSYQICDHEDLQVCGTALVTITVRPILLDLSKTPDVAEVEFGEIITYTITLANRSQFELTGVQVEDVLPDGLLFVGSSPSQGEGGVWLIPSVPAGGSVSVELQALAAGSGLLVNKATVTIGDYEDEVSSPAVIVGLKPVNLIITKTSFGIEIFEGNEFEYEIQVSNVGTTEATDVSITDNLPSSLRYIGFTSTDIQGTPNVTGNTVSLTVPTLAAGASVTFRIRVKATQVGPLSNTASFEVGEGQVQVSPNTESTDANQVKAFFIPNVITPRTRDGKNDTFVIGGIDGFQGHKLTIFNRNGDHVYETERYANDWSGEGLAGGTYYYVLVTVNSDGTEQTYKGWIQVLK